MKIYLNQTKTENDTYKNFNKLEKVFEKENCDLIISPELFLAGFEFKNLSERAAEEFDYLQKIQKLCALHKKAFCASFLVREKKDFFNRAFFIDDKGGFVQTYDKNNLIAVLKEDKFLKKGVKESFFRYKNISMGPAICYDLRFPELFRRYAKKETEVYLVMAQWPHERITQMITLAKARAIENQCYVILVNAVGLCKSIKMGGSSLVINSYGGELLNLRNALSGKSFELNLKEIHKHRKEFPALYSYSRGRK
ncbi:MAG: hypothetical protein OEZ13_12635 [Spirochaetia bacterium]|nr:hypothetical protein [Spirochaetia bacterium]